jgi:hypothetical protein
VSDAVIRIVVVAAFPLNTCGERSAVTPAGSPDTEIVTGPMLPSRVSLTVVVPVVPLSRVTCGSDTAMSIDCGDGDFGAVEVLPSQDAIARTAIRTPAAREEARNMFNSSCTSWLPHKQDVLDCGQISSL